MSDDNSTDKLLRELVATVNTLKNVDELKVKDVGRTYPRKCQRNGDSKGDGNESHDGDNDDNREGIPARWRTMALAPTFLETTFNSRLDYKDRKKQIVKYGEPDSKWTTCPSISPVVAATLPPAAIRDDKAAFRSQ